MIGLQYMRAEYDKDRGTYVSNEADWIDGEPSLEHCFSLRGDEAIPRFWEGGLEKVWRDQGSGKVR